MCFITTFFDNLLYFFKVSFHADLGREGLDLRTEGICIQGENGKMLDYQVKNEK